MRVRRATQSKSAALYRSSTGNTRLHEAKDDRTVRGLFPDAHTRLPRAIDKIPGGCPGWHLSPVF